MASTDIGQQQLLDNHPALQIEQLFQVVVKLGGSHLHLKVGRRPLRGRSWTYYGR